MNTILNQLERNLVVSCQAYTGEPLRDAATMARMAEAVVAGGASGVRLQGLEDIRLAAQRIHVPIIGLVKEGNEGVYITPTVELALAVADAGAHIVALDGTPRPRRDSASLAETIRTLRTECPDAIVMADCDSVSSAEYALAAGADVLSTTLAGYTKARTKCDGPDLALLRAMVTAFPDVPVIAEGRIHSPKQARACLDAGAFSVVVGTAITHPTSITGWFKAALRA